MFRLIRLLMLPNPHPGRPQGHAPTIYEGIVRNYAVGIRGENQEGDFRGECKEAAGSTGEILRCAQDDKRQAG